MDDLKKAIKQEKENAFPGINGSTLNLWKVRRSSNERELGGLTFGKLNPPIPAAQCAERLEHVQSPQEIPGSVELNPLDVLSEHFDSPLPKHLHLVVQIPPAGKFARHLSVASLLSYLSTIERPISMFCAPFTGVS